MILVQETPNPSALKFVVPEKWTSFVWECVNESDAAKSDLAKLLWNIDGVKYLLFGNDFVSVSKDSAFSWDLLQPSIVETIDAFLKKDIGLFETEDSKQDMVEKKDICNKLDEKKFSDFEMQIFQVIEEKVQPALESHGGMVEFIGFQDGVVTLDMQGACRGCPSSEYTLQQGIFNLLNYYFPEIKKVVSL